jgi:hypothetical protein
MTTADKLTKIARNMKSVYDGGKEKGFEEGATAQERLFWSDFQENGARTAYNNAFQNGWTDEIFQPKYSMLPATASYMFAGTKIANLKSCLEDNGVVLDTSNATSLDYMFSNATNFTHCPVISGVKESYFTSTFYNCKKLISIDKFILKDDGSQTFSNDCFQHCSELVEIRIEGAIGNNINFQWSKKLSMMSLASIVSALLKTVTGKTITLPNTARETYDAATYPGRWDEIVAEYPNWTFKYA